MEDKAQLDEKFLECRKEIAEKATKEYEEIYKRMVNKLNPSQLEPCAQIVLDKDGNNFNCASSIECMKDSILPELLDAWNKVFWEPIALDKLTELQMIKDHFEGHVGTNWEIKTKAPAQRLLPLSMRYKKKRVDYLKKQIEYQTKLIEEKCAQAIIRRNFLQNIKEQGFQLNECIEDQLKQKMQEEKIKEEFQSFLRDESVDVFEAKPKVVEEF